MRQTSGPAKEPAEQVVKDIRRATRRHFSGEDKIRIVLDGLRGEDSIAELCRREGIVQNLYYRWSKEFLKAGKKFDLSNALHAPAVPYAYPDAVDPRGFLTFGLAGLGTAIISMLLLRGNILSRGVAVLGVVSGILLVVLYLAFLIFLDPANPIVVALVVASGIIQPVWNIWIGSLLFRSEGSASTR